jgi:DNA-binding Lrp family transcriptional regulator
MENLDELDQKLLYLLQEDARKPFTQIAEEVGRPDTTVHFRTKKLQERGIVTRFAALVEPEACGYHDACLLRIEIGGHIIPEISQDRTLTFAEELAEDDDFLLVAVAKEPMIIRAILMGFSEDTITDKVNELEKAPDVVSVDSVSLTQVVKGWELSRIREFDFE